MPGAAQACYQLIIFHTPMISEMSRGSVGLHISSSVSIFFYLQSSPQTPTRLSTSPSHSRDKSKEMTEPSKTSELWYVINFAAHLLHFYSKALLSTSNHIHPYRSQTMHIAIDAVNFSALIPISTAATNQIVQSRKGTDLKTVQSQTFQCGAEQPVHIFMKTNIIWEYCEGIMWA